MSTEAAKGGEGVDEGRDRLDLFSNIPSIDVYYAVLDFRPPNGSDGIAVRSIMQVASLKLLVPAMLRHLNQTETHREHRQNEYTNRYTTDVSTAVN